MEEITQNWIMEKIEGELQHNDLNIEDLAEDLFNLENNYNNADVTSKQTVHSKEEITQLIEERFKIVCKKEDHCSNCGRPHDEEGDIIESNSVPYGDTHVNENICVGHVCQYCGEEE